MTISENPKTIYIHAEEGQTFSKDGETMTEIAKEIEKGKMALGYDGAIFEDEFGDIDFSVMKFTLLEN